MYKKDLIAVNERPTNCEFTGRFCTVSTVELKLQFLLVTIQHSDNCTLHVLGLYLQVDILKFEVMANAYF